MAKKLWVLIIAHTYFLLLLLVYPLAQSIFFSKKMGDSQTHFESFHACFELVMGTFQAQNQKNLHNMAQKCV